MDAFIATILPVGFDFAPYGWAQCSGQLLSVNNYQAAFSLVSTSYGGDGRTTFGLPDLRGRHPVGYVTMTGGRKYPLGEAKGQEEVSLSTANIPPHNHSADFTPTTGSVPVTIPAVTGSQSVTVKLEAKAVAGDIQLPVANSYLAGGPSSSIKTYAGTSASASASAVELAGISGSISGQPSIPAQQTTINAVTGGTVTTAVVGAGAAVPTISPYLAINFIFCLQGIYPTRG